MSHRKRVLIFIVAYNAARKVVGVLGRIPASLGERYEVEVLIIDDCSTDNTAEVAREYLKGGYWCDVRVLRNPVNQGYGGNQKIGYKYAMDSDFDLVALLHGDGQYAPESLPQLLASFDSDRPPGAVFGSRMIDRGGALKGGMPLYKFVGNKILTNFQNSLLCSNLSEFHSGYRLYRVAILRHIPFHLNTEDFHFDTEIIVQVLFSDQSIVEVPIPTHYGDEVCHVNGLRYAWDVVKTSAKARLVRMGIFFDPKFDLAPADSVRYVDKFAFSSTHTKAFDLVETGSIVLDMGCADGHLSKRLSLIKGCEVYCSDLEPEKHVEGCSYNSCNLNDELPDVPWERLDYVVLLDVIEHLTEPERFLARLRERLSTNRKVRVILSSGNVCFFVTRLMMLFGEFNYGKRGILDMTHTRLFNGKTLNRLVRYGSYNVLDRSTIPAPYPLAIGLNAVSRLLLAGNALLARILPGLFAYQVMLVAQPKPSTEWLLEQALKTGVVDGSQ